MKEKEHLWLKLTTVTANNKKYLFVTKKDCKDLDFEKLADGMQYLEKIKNDFDNVYCCITESDKSPYNKLFARCCEAQNMVVRYTNSLQTEIDKVINYKKEQQKERKQSKQTKENAGYKKIFPHVTTDDNDSDFDKAIDDMIFMDLMDDDF